MSERQRLQAENFSVTIARVSQATGFNTDEKVSYYTRVDIIPRAPENEKDITVEPLDGSRSLLINNDTQKVVGFQFEGPVNLEGLPFKRTLAKLLPRRGIPVDTSSFRQAAPSTVETQEVKHEQDPRERVNRRRELAILIEQGLLVSFSNEYSRMTDPEADTFITQKLEQLASPSTGELNRIEQLERKIINELSLLRSQEVRLLGLPWRIEGSFIRSNIHTIDQVRDQLNRFKNIRGIGTKTFRTVKNDVETALKVYDDEVKQEALAMARQRAMGNYVLGMHNPR